jgi:hypothetical protein
MTAQELYDYLGQALKDGKLNPNAKIAVGNVYFGGGWRDQEIIGLTMGDPKSKYKNPEVVYVVEGDGIKAV